MSRKIVGITGRAGAGKDCVLRFIKERLPDIEEHRFAGPLKEATCKFFGWTAEQIEDREFKEAIDPVWGFSPRVAMQRLGTEWGRGLRDDLWIHMARVRLVRSNSQFVFPDVRFENEADFVRTNNGILIHVIRPGNKISNSDHASEAGIEIKDADIVIDNNGSLDDLRTKVWRVIDNQFWS